MMAALLGVVEACIEGCIFRSSHFFFVAPETRDFTKTDERRAGKRSARFVKSDDKPVQSQRRRFSLDITSR